MRFRILLSALSATLLGGAAFAVAPKPVAESGLLLGFWPNRGTAWIAQHGDSMRLEWRSDQLVVPRDDGYWFVTSAERCSVNADSMVAGAPVIGPIGFVDREQQIVIARAASTVSVQFSQSQDCGDAAKLVYTARARQYRAALDSVGGDSSKVELPPPSEDDDHVDCNLSFESVAFLSSSAIALEQRVQQTEYCSPGGYTTEGTNVVMGFNRRDTISLRSMLTPAVLRAAEKESRSASEGDFAMRHNFLDGGWVPKRYEGKWVANVWLNGSNAERGGREYETHYPLPRRFTGEGALPVSWAALQKEYANLTDAFASPSGNLLAIGVIDSLIIRRVEGGRLGSTVARIGGLPIANVVMIRWATAAERERWTRDLPHLQPPTLRITARP